MKTDQAPDSGFSGYQIVLQYTGNLNLVQQGGLSENRWPPCGQGILGGSYEAKIVTGAGNPGRYIIGCKGPIDKDYKGILANIHFACKGTGSGLISIIGGGGAQVSFYDRPSIHGNRIFLAADPKGGKQLADSVLINCGGIAGTSAGDADGDGCPNERELGGNEMTGGRRDYMNPWDYFNPSHDHQNRVDDILLVVNQYFKDVGSPDYQMGTDRTFVGPNDWNLGPLNGVQRVDDILNMVKQYFHDC